MIIKKTHNKAKRIPSRASYTIVIIVRLRYGPIILDRNDKFPSQMLAANKLLR